MEQEAGIEPAYATWKVAVLPLNYTCKLADAVGFEPTELSGSPVFKTGAISRSATRPLRDWDLNPGPEAYEASELPDCSIPLNLFYHACYLRQ